MSAIYYDSSEKLAEILGFSGVRRVQQLTKEGVLLRDANGKYDIPNNVERYFKNKLAGVADLDREKALHERAKRELAEITLAKTKGEIHLAGDVELLLTGMLVNFRSRLLAMPQKLAPQIVGMETIAEIAGVLETTIGEALMEISEYDPAMFAEVQRATDNDRPVPEDAEEVGSAAAQDDGEPVGGPASAPEPGKRGGTRKVADKPSAVSKGDHGRRKRPTNGKGCGAGKQPSRKK